LRVPRVVELGSYSPAGVFDTMQRWWSGAKRTVALDDLAWALGLETSKSDEVDGSQVFSLYKAGRLDIIREYNLKDVRLTRQVYERLVESLGR
jgi:predicted PolB exonuclease-like 3'-5' exonuclease